MKDNDDCEVCGAKESTEELITIRDEDGQIIPIKFTNCCECGAEYVTRKQIIYNDNIYIYTIINKENANEFS